MSARCNCVAAAHSKNGTSLATSTRTSPRPQGSWVVSHGGGAFNPVAQGEKARNSQPLGAIKKAKPMAKAACGTASRGPNARTRADHRRPGKWCDSSQAARAMARPLASTPVIRVSPTARQVWVSAHTLCHAARSKAPRSAAPTVHTSGTARTAMSSRAMPRSVRQTGERAMVSARPRRVPPKPGRPRHRQTGRLESCQPRERPAADGPPTGSVPRSRR